MLLTMAIDSYKFAENKCQKLLAERENNCSSSSGSSSSSTAVTTTVLPMKKIVNFLDNLDGKFFGEVYYSYFIFQFNVNLSV
jgi:hypothetical protein